MPHDAKGCNDGSTEWAVDDLGYRYAELLIDLYDLALISGRTQDDLSNAVGLAAKYRLDWRDDYGDVVKSVEGLVRHFTGEGDSSG